MSPQKVETLSTYIDNFSLPQDFEVFVELSASEFSKNASFKLTINQAKEIFEEMGIKNIPTRIDGTTKLDDYIKDLGGLSETQINTFYDKASNVQQ